MSRHVKAWLAVWVLAAAWIWWHQSRDVVLEDIVVADETVTVRNQTTHEWTDVRIWVNEHYAASARSVPGGGVVREPLSRFLAAQGQRLDGRHSTVTSVVVLAKTPEGERVRITWGKPLLH